MVQLQFLNAILASKDYSIIQDNGITSDYFFEYEDEFQFIKTHYETYHNVPDTETFISNFPDFDLLEVTESEKYLVSTLREEYLYSKSVPVIKHAADLLKVDANEASRYLQSEMLNLTPTYTTTAVDIIHSKDRVAMFEDRSKNPDKYFIPTGFEELDDVVCGWQMGEELVVIVARTNQGKSWITEKTITHSWQMGKNVGFISPEMTANKVGYRFDTLYNHFSNRALTRGSINEISLDDYNNYFDELSKNETKFFVSTPLDFDKKITVSKLRNYIRENEIEILAIDGITYLTDERYKYGDNKTTTLTNISEDLIQLSVEMQIPIIVVVQSNRGGIKEGDSDTPALEDIRDSDGIAFNATKVISLRQKEDNLVLEIRKNRDGAVGVKLNYIWDIDTGEFTYNPSSDDMPKMKMKEPKNEPEKEQKPKQKERRIAF